MNYNLDNILNGCKKQDHESQKLLYNMYASRLIALCKRYVGEHDCDDIFQESMLKAFSNIEQLKSSNDIVVMSWLKRICINNCLRFLQKNKRLDLVTIEELHENAVAIDDEEELSIAKNDIAARLILLEIEKLSESWKTVFYMSVVDGLSHKEIGENLGIDEVYSRVILNRAKSTIKTNVVKQLEKQLA